MAYRAAIPRLLREVGWQVESDDFVEIEDPDPDNHEARQRELIREIEGARKEAEAKPEKRRFGLFKRGKLAEKKGWETYDESKKEGIENEDTTHGVAERHDSRVLFDIDAIRAELESEHMEVRQLESTLPPMRLELNGSRAASDRIPQGEFAALRTTKSYDGTSLPADSGTNINVPHISLPNGYDKDFHPKDLDADDDHINGDGRVTMSFNPNPPLPSAVLAWQSQTLSETNTPVTPQRPQLRSAVTMPVVSGGLQLEHNAWADEDEDFGEEKEVKMVFE